MTAVEHTGPDSVRDLPPIEVRPIESVREAPDNPRKITARAVEQTALSLRRFGWKQPLVVDSDGVLIVGHTRHRAAKALGLRHVPVTVAGDLDREEARAYRIADNRTGDFSTWDFPELVQQLEELAPDFSDVLALADWEAIVGDFNDLSEPAVDDGLDLDDGMPEYLDSTRPKYALVVVCESEDAMRRVAGQAIDLAGVLDVRQKTGGKAAE